MKIYSKKDFLELPAGTFFAKGFKWVMDGFCIKGDTIENDFYYVNLVNIQSFNTEQLYERYELMLENGLSFPINSHSERDGMFDNKDIFLVFEKEDLRFIGKLIDNQLNSGN